MNKYPYPVLAYEDSSYIDSISWEIQYVKNICLADKVIFEFINRLNSSYLKKIISENKARCFVKVQTNIFTKIEEIRNIEGNIQCEIPRDKLLSNDKLQFTAYIAVKNEFDLTFCDEFLPIYGEKYSIKLKKNDVLALTNTEILTFSTCNNDFIKFSVAKEQSGKGYKIDFRENSIVVLVGPEMNKAYGVVKGNKSEICSIFDSHLVFEVFLYTLIQLIQYYDEYAGKTWCDMFEQIFMQAEDKYSGFEQFVSEVNDSGKFDMDQVFEVAQKMVNNQIENSIIAVGIVEEG